MNVNAGVVSPYPTSLSAEEEKWKAINYGHVDANMNSGCVDPVAMSYFPPENATTYINPSNVSGNTSKNEGGTANVQNFMSGFVTNVQYNNTGFGSFFFNPLGLFTTNYNNTAPSNTGTVGQMESSSNYVATPNNMGTVTPSSSLPEYSYPTSHSPMQMAFMTPNQGPTPCTSPPDTPLFLDSHSFQDDIMSVATNQNVQVSVNYQESAPLVHHSIQGNALPSTSSRFARGIGTMSSALGSVADYVNQSLLLGIPFHIADHAMKESKESYAKWWEGGIGNKRKSDDDNKSEDRAGQPAGKKRRLDFDTAASRAGSILTMSLTKNYDRELIETYNSDRGKVVTPYSTPVVDSSIIKRRRVVQKHTESPIVDSIVQLKSDNCYNVFNDIGGMYDLGETNESDHDNKDGGDEVDAGNELLFNHVRPDKVPNPLHESNDHRKAQRTSSVTTATSSWNNLDGAMKVIGELIEEKNRLSDENELFQMVKSPRDWVKKSIRSELIEALQLGKGDVHDKRFLSVLEILSNFYKTSGRDARVSPWSGSGIEFGGPKSSDYFEGSWVNMSRPNYIECLGENGDNDFMYTLGRMSFDMFQPSNLICSVQSTHTTIKIIGEREELPAFVPKSLKEEVASLCDLGDDDGTAKRPLLRSYDIAISLTIEPPSSVGQPESPGTPIPTKRMRAVMSVKGYVLPDRCIPNRLTVWFTSGQLAPARLASNDETDTIDEDGPEFNKANSQRGDAESDDGYGGFDEWTAMFAKGKWRKTLGQRARAMASKLLLGAELPNKMEEDGQMNYVLRRPIGGHGKVYVEVLYLDEDILIMRGHHGTIYAMARSCVSQRYVSGKSSTKVHV